MDFIAIKIYSRRKDGGKKISANFRVREFASHDGADEVRIDTRLVALLQQIRDKFGKAVVINSGYRTKKHNKAVGGASNSYHTQGKAADIAVKGVSARRVAQYAEIAGASGIGWYEVDGFTHIDTRSNRYFWKDSGGNARKTFSDCPYSEPTANLIMGSSGTGVKWLQWHLKKIGYSHIVIDGNFGAQTKLAVKDFQRKCSLTVDGIAGKNTRLSLKKEIV